MIRARSRFRVSFNAYFKFAPVTTASSGGIFDSREIAGGLAYAFKLANDHNLSITFDASSFHLIASDITVSTSSYSVGIGYTLF